MELDKDCCGNVVAAEQQAQHTPGPLLVRGDITIAADNGDLAIVNSKGTLIGFVYNHGARTLPTALLFAAAPDMLAALRDAIVALGRARHRLETVDISLQDETLIDNAQRSALAAIAKVEGQ